jgi:phytanoyl-CoA hydroxylase
LHLSEAQIDQYQREGYLMLRNAVPEDLLDELEEKFLGLVAEWGGRHFSSAQSPDLAQFLLENRALERRIYDGIRIFPWLKEFSLAPEITGPVTDLLGKPAGLMSKIPFRMDLPGVVRELAVWHQDYRYVLGNEDVVTAFIPLQDTPFVRGCLMIMPGSHKLGILDHDVEVLGKRHFPSTIFDREVRYAEMKRGDLLLFHSLLLHSLGLNLSSTALLTVQSRYSALSAQTDPGMGDIIPIN